MNDSPDLTPDEIQSITDFLVTVYPGNIENVEVPEEVSDELYRYTFWDGPKHIEVMVNEKAMKIATRILNPDDI
ncbi:hypothetical protein [Synechocystis salina]|uniref:Uncharacterized protein n=1 Tax=Synechocystis salina LEGE 00031 TaxID=1828736 RepID=A0ABR9VW66_9SYNC|nr:hypothetical protein [Synechocystis salina]MBE9242251.1 hypothetical protein [Synechocystis salina LEGE 00041]MBE9254481.1 hypothetical protein [Synechocystis salina LEGE 00031]